MKKTDMKHVIRERRGGGGDVKKWNVLEIKAYDSEKKEELSIQFVEFLLKK